MESARAFVWWLAENNPDAGWNPDVRSEYFLRRATKYPDRLKEEDGTSADALRRYSITRQNLGSIGADDLRLRLMNGR